jgi:predicted amidohydrolase
LKVALVHVAIGWKEKEKNISKLLELNERAAASGGQIIVNTELATTGYAFESRSEISPRGDHPRPDVPRPSERSERSTAATSASDCWRWTQKRAYSTTLPP